MSPKIGKCRLCPVSEPSKMLYGDGVCAYHLANPKDDQSKVKLRKVAAEIVVPDDQLLQQFYREQWTAMPKHCENGCGARLLALSLHKAKFMICHIVPKKHFKSVMVHPLNRLFMCWQCHQVYDQSWAKAVAMPVWPLAVERFSSFMTLIKDAELKHLPDAFRNLIENSPPC